MINDIGEILFWVGFVIAFTVFIVDSFTVDPFAGLLTTALILMLVGLIIFLVK